MTTGGHRLSVGAVRNAKRSARAVRNPKGFPQTGSVNRDPEPAKQP